MSFRGVFQKFLFLFLWAFFWVVPVQGGPILKVAVVNAEPFCWKDGQEFKGIAIDLWEKAAQKNGWQYEYIALDPKVLDIDFYLLDPSVKPWDVLIGPINKTDERSTFVHFSVPYFLNQVDVVRYHSTSFWHGTFVEILKELPYGFFFSFICLTFLISIVLNWLDNHNRKNERFGTHKETFWRLLTILFIPGVSSDRYIPTLTMKLITIGWTLCQLLLSIAISTLIVGKVLSNTLLDAGEQSLDALKGENIGVLRGTMPVQYAQDYGFAVLESNPQDLLGSVNSGKVPYGIVDRELLNVAQRQKTYESLKVLKVFIHHGSYHFALRKDLDPEILTGLNDTLLQLQESGQSSKMCGLYVLNQRACIL